MDQELLKKEFEKHMASRECERPSKAMLFELFLEGYKLGKTEIAPNKKPEKTGFSKKDLD